MNKSILTFLMGVAICGYTNAQMILPEFQPPVKEETLSSEAEESMPLPFNQGNNFYFFRTYIEGDGAKAKVVAQDIWYSEKDKEAKWDDPYRLFRADYLEGNNSIIGTTRDGNRVYLFNTVYTKESETKRLVYLDKAGKKDKWTPFTEVLIPGFTFEEKYYSFSINPDEDILLISMSPSVSHLDEDLYVSLKQKDGTWGEVINLGENINTNRFEISPFIAEDKKTLYFASNGHDGYGAADIYVAYRLDDSWTQWTKPLNMGEAINSPAYEAYFVMGNNQEVYFTSDRDAEHSNIYYTKATGGFKFAHQNAQFVYKGLPSDGVKLYVYNESGVLIDSLVTDGFGRFQYKKLSADENYTFKLADSEEDDMIGSIIYLLNEEGKKTRRFIFTREKVFVYEALIAEVEKLTGRFNYNSLPMKNATLVVYDANGFPIDTLYTNEFGKFDYNKIAYEDGFSIVPIDMLDEDWESMEVYLTDSNGREFRLIHRNDRLVFVANNKEEQQLAIPGDTELKEKEKTIGESNTGSGGWNGMSAEEKYIHFDFTETSLSVAEKEKLSALALLLQAETNVKVKIVGHTDELGPETVNHLVGLNRARAVKNYLIAKKISANRLEVVSEGEKKPIASNETEVGQARNRRVEIILK